MGTLKSRVSKLEGSPEKGGRAKLGRRVSKSLALTEKGERNG